MASKDGTHAGCCEDPSSPKKNCGGFGMTYKPSTHAGLIRETTVECIEAVKKPLAFDAPEAGCQAQNDLPRKPFVDELRSLINRHCVENDSNTPDFLLAEYLLSVLNAYTTLNNKRERWYGRKVF